MVILGSVCSADNLDTEPAWDGDVLRVETKRAEERKYQSAERGTVTWRHNVEKFLNSVDRRTELLIRSCEQVFLMNAKSEGMVNHRVDRTA